MQYVSTRGSAPTLDFGDVLLTGLAADGGLYVPEHWPRLPRLAPEASYAEVATAVMEPFVAGSLEADELATLVEDAYATFSHPAVVPLVDLGDDHHLMELFWGPTLAFKDVALQLVGRLFDHELGRRHQRLTIVGATSGDTGSAAIEACRDRDPLDLFILFPDGRVSDFQRRQMTTVRADNIHTIAVEGTFDDCQDLVKAMFADEAFRTERSLGAVNSINWARVMAQIVYYVWAWLQVGQGGPVSFCVPTGNFGNLFAGEAARRMGLDVDQFIVASNRNAILTQFFTTGAMTIGPVSPTLSPAMDIQVSSNLERLLFELLGRDGIQVAELMARFRGEGHVEMPADQFAPLGERWSAAAIDDERTVATIAELAARTGMVVDPHTAVALAAAQDLRSSRSPLVTLATAHPAKFADAVAAAGVVPPEPPDSLSDLLQRPEQYVTLPNDLAAVQDYVRSIAE